MPEEWISQNEYMRRTGMGFNAVKHLIATKQLETKSTGNRVRIRVGGDTVSRTLYEEEKAKRIEAETTLKLLQTVLLERSTKEVYEFRRN